MALQGKPWRPREGLGNVPGTGSRGVGVPGSSLPSLEWTGMGTHPPHDGVRWDQTVDAVVGGLPRACLLLAIPSHCRDSQVRAEPTPPRVTPASITVSLVTSKGFAMCRFSVTVPRLDNQSPPTAGWALGHQKQPHVVFLFSFSFFLFLVFLPFLEPHPWHMEVPRLGVQSEL